LHGAQGLEETVYPLPGLDLPQEVYPPALSSLGELVEVIAGQEEFVTRLYRHPAIVAEFGHHPPNMNDLNDRLRVWSTLYRVFQQQDIGFGSLHGLMRLMEQYLRFFTRHTQYDVRDFGISYLTSDFPQDLAGRTARDCGVYALTVAYEVYQTAHSARPRLPVQFRLYAMPEHIALVIFDLDQDTHYVVNNNRIDGPFSGDVGRSFARLVVARLYAEERNLRFGVSPVVSVELGSSSMEERAFRSSAWQRFRRIVAGWHLRPEPGPGAEAERINEAYRRYYQDIRDFNTYAGQLSAGLDALVQALRSAPPSNSRPLLAEQLPDLLLYGRLLGGTIATYSPERAIAWETSERAASHLGIYHIPPRPGETTSHPLVRLGKALLYYQSLGGTLERAQEFIQAVRSDPDFNADLDAYVGQRYPLEF
jgi:hypothetical protein